MNKKMKHSYGQYTMVRNTYRKKGTENRISSTNTMKLILKLSFVEAHDRVIGTEQLRAF